MKKITENKIKTYHIEEMQEQTQMLMDFLPKVYSDDIQSRDVTIFPLPSLSNYDLWEFIGDRGVYSESPEHLISCFDVFYHSKGKLYYRKKYKKDRKPVTETSLSHIENLRETRQSCEHPFFKGVYFHDPMQSFLLRSEIGDEIGVMPTHYVDEKGKLKEYIVLENEGSITYEQYKIEVQ